MTLSTTRTLLTVGAAVLFISGCNKASPPASTNSTETAAATNTPAAANAPGDPIASAESAAPASIAHNASVVQIDPTGALKELRKGTNGWTCMPDAPETPGPDPMCVDANAMKWAAAWMGHKAPPDGTAGVIYMLEGGTDASNTDPYAKQPTAENNWIKTGPQVMVVGSTDSLAGHPSGAKPDTSVPYVMWAGTPYAHLMVPIH